MLSSGDEMRLNVRMALQIATLTCLCLHARFASATSCATTTLNNLLGTTCTIGDVSYTFLNSGAFVFASESFTDGTPGTGISASSLIFTPDGSDPLDPSFSISGPLSVSTTGAGNSAEETFQFFFTATAVGSGLQIGTATNTLVDPEMPSAPSYGEASAGNNLGYTNIYHSDRANRRSEYEPRQCRDQSHEHRSFERA
jgi:hypothetical protein